MSARRHDRANGGEREGRRRAAAVGLVLLLAAGCVGQGRPDPGGANLTVLAAASLTEAFGALDERFAASHPGVSTEVSFESSSTLVAQVQQGIPASVVATADERTMAELASAGLLDGAPRVFALNELTIVVEPGNPQDVRGLTDLARDTLKVVLAAEEVPAGAYARQALRAAGVDVDPVSLEEDVKAVVTKVSLGEADAGIAYVTDARAAGTAVATVPIPAEHNVVARYPIAVLREAPEPDLAEAFVALVLSEEGRRVLVEAGFGVP